MSRAAAWVRFCLFLSFFFLMLGGPPGSTLFPYTTLFRSRSPWLRVCVAIGVTVLAITPALMALSQKRLNEDRKSTRLNSSHLGISYAVFCLKKKTGIKHRTHDQTHRQGDIHNTTETQSKE